MIIRITVLRQFSIIGFGYHLVMMFRWRCGQIVKPVYKERPSSGYQTLHRLKLGPKNTGRCWQMVVDSGSTVETFSF